MSGCCGEYGCKRRDPYKIRFAGFTQRWMLVTRYSLKADNLMVAYEKHDINDELVAALLDAGWTPPPGENGDSVALD